MVMDFGFVKEVMIERIHNPCDHGTILWVYDEILKTIPDNPSPKWFKTCIINTVPTAENLARYWWGEVDQGIHEYGLRNNIDFKDVTLAEIRVWETPNCVAWYPIVDPLQLVYPNVAEGVI